MISSLGGQCELGFESSASNVGSRAELGSVVMCALFEAQLPSSQLPPAVCVDIMSPVCRRPSNGGSLRYFTCVIHCCMTFAERSEKQHPEKGIIKNMYYCM